MNNSPPTMEDQEQRRKDQHDPSTIILQSMTHPLWFPMENQEQQWNNQHNASASLQCTTYPLFSNRGWRAEMKSLAWSLHQNAAMHYSPSMIFKQDEGRMWNDQHDPSMSMLPCITHPLWFSMEDQEQRWNHQYDHSTSILQCTTHFLWFSM